MTQQIDMSTKRTKTEQTSRSSTNRRRLPCVLCIVMVLAKDNVLDETKYADGSQTNCPRIGLSEPRPGLQNDAKKQRRNMIPM